MNSELRSRTTTHWNSFSEWRRPESNILPAVRLGVTPRQTLRHENLVLPLTEVTSPRSTETHTDTSPTGLSFSSRTSYRGGTDTSEVDTLSVAECEWRTRLRGLGGVGVAQVRVTVTR